MLHETVEALNVAKNGIYIDGTLGGGGHSGEILRRGGRVVAFDLDLEAIEYVSGKFKAISEFSERYTIIHGNFKDCVRLIDDKLGIGEIDGAVLDLGVSSYQIDNKARGFSYMGNDRLDMRMDTSKGRTAYDIVNEWDEDELRRILYTYGEEKNAKKIVGRILERRAIKAIETTGELSELVHNCFPPFVKGGHPAKRTFQALRIAVNNELSGLDKALKDIVGLLKPQARLSVITFHSLEDRIVKQTFKSLSENCICDKSIPVCVCKNEAKIKLLGKGIKPSDIELKENSRSKSATLRIAEKI